MKREYICIVCPRGCHVTIDQDMKISGNKCPRGKVYVETEMKSPMRILTTTIRSVFKDEPRISCKTHVPIPKELIFDAMEIINKLVIDKPMEIGTVVIENILASGANIVLTKACRGENKI